MSPWFPILGVFFCFVLMLSLPLETWIRFFVWLGIGLVIYFLYGASHSKLRGGIDTAFTRERRGDSYDALKEQGGILDPEAIAETYYSANVGPGMTLGLGYQLLLNPAYNADRGPVSIVSLRMRAAF